MKSAFSIVCFVATLSFAAACSGAGAGSPTPSSTGTAPAGDGTPSPTAQHYAMQMSAIDVPADAELYKCQDFTNPFGKDVAILQSESVMSAGSHHFAAFRIAGLTTAAVQDCPAGGLEAHEFIHASQQLDQVTSYPPGVGRFLPATDGIRLMVHFLNTTGQTLHVAATTFTMNYVDADQVQSKAGGVFLNNLGIMVPPGVSSASKSFTLPSDIKLLVAVSHMHEHAVGFTSSTSDGRMLYETKQWSEPKAASFDPPIDIVAGTGITWTCSFQNDTGQTLTFGESASKNEMCIFNGVYYPSPDGSSIVQNLP
jgi:hypothetical protein